MIVDRVWLPFCCCSPISASTFLASGLTRGSTTPKVSPRPSPIRPAIFDCPREAAFSRLTSVLPSRLASTLFSSSAIFSNSASSSSCLLTAS